MTAILALAAYGITVLETFISAEYTRAVASSRATAAGLWAAAFEAVLCVDIWLLVDRWWLALPIVIGAFHGAVWSVRRKRGEA